MCKACEAKQKAAQAAGMVGSPTVVRPSLAADIARSKARGPVGASNKTPKIQPAGPSWDAAIAEVPSITYIELWAGQIHEFSTALTTQWIATRLRKVFPRPYDMANWLQGQLPELRPYSKATVILTPSTNAKMLLTGVVGSPATAPGA